MDLEAITGIFLIGDKTLDQTVLIKYMHLQMVDIIETVMEVISMLIVVLILELD